MHDSPGGFTDKGGVLDAGTTELPDQDVLHRQSGVGGVAVAGKVDQTGHEVRELVGSQEQKGAPTRSEVDNRLRHGDEVLRVQSEELGARNRLDDVQHQLTGVAGIAVRERQRLIDAPRDEWNLKHVRVHGRHREQADESVFERPTLPHDVLADHHDVGVGAIAEKARHGGLRQYEQIVFVGQLPEDLVPQPQYAEPAGGVDVGLAVLYRTPFVAPQKEVSLGGPAHTRGQRR